MPLVDLALVIGCQHHRCRGARALVLGRCPSLPCRPLGGPEAVLVAMPVLLPIKPTIRIERAMLIAGATTRPKHWS